MIGNRALCTCLLLGAAMAAMGCSSEVNLIKCRSVDPETSIAGCTAVIQRGLLTTEHLSIIYNNRGTAYGSKGDHDRAIQDFNEAILLSPNDAYTYRDRGIEYYEKGDYDRAIQDYDQAIRLNPNDTSVYCLACPVVSVIWTPSTRCGWWGGWGGGGGGCGGGGGGGPTATPTSSRAPRFTDNKDDHDPARTAPPSEETPETRPPDARTWLDSALSARTPRGSEPSAKQAKLLLPARPQRECALQKEGEGRRDPGSQRSDSGLQRSNSLEPKLCTHGRPPAHPDARHRGAYYGRGGAYDRLGLAYDNRGDYDQDPRRPSRPD